MIECDWCDGDGFARDKDHTIVGLCSNPVHSRKDIKPCPFCQNPEPELMEKYILNRKVFKHYLYCDVCFATGPYAFSMTKEDSDASNHAIKLWNDRK